MDPLKTLFFESSSLSSFGHLLEMAFGCGIAYAVLIRTGQWQGSHIEEYCNERYREATEAWDLLTADEPAFSTKIKIGANKLRCDNHAAECKKQIGKLVRYFAVAAVLVSVFCIIVLLIAGIWNPAVPNIVI